MNNKIPLWIQFIYKDIFYYSVYGSTKIKYFEKSESFEVSRKIGYTKFLISLYGDNRCIGTKNLDVAGSGLCFLVYGDNWDDEGKIIKQNVGDIL